MYARGTSTQDISAQLEELYGAKVSASLISEFTDTVSEDVKAWQCRPLDEVYPIVYLDALYINIKVSGRVSKRAVYVVLGLTVEATRLLGALVFAAIAQAIRAITVVVSHDDSVVVVVRDYSFSGIGQRRLCVNQP